MFDSQRFSQQTILITGASGGIGQVLARRLSAEGARVVLFGRSKELLEGLASALPGESLVVVGDGTQLDDLDRLLERTRERFGSLDGLVLAAAIAPFAPLEELDDAVFDATFDINVRGRFFLVQKSLDLLVPGSAIVLLSAGFVDRPIVGSSLYTASMAASRALAKAWALELRDRGIRVCSVSPGPTNTALYDPVGEQTEVEELKAALGGRTLRERMADPSEIAATIAFLLAPDGKFVNGTDLLVDGGFALS